jgi:uncharacterized protein YjdB
MIGGRMEAATSALPLCHNRMPLLLLASALALSACGGGGDGPSGPTPVAQVVITSPAGPLTFGALDRTVVFTAEARDASGNVLTGRSTSWSSSNSAAVSITAGGVATAEGNGAAQITATVEGVVSDPVTVTVAQVTAQVAATPATANFGAKGSTRQLAAQALDSTNNAIAGKSASWSSTNPAVATVSAAGLVTSVADGATQVVASIDGFTDTVAVNVAILVATVAVSPSGTTTFNAAGQTQQFTAQALDSNANAVAGKTFSWFSTNTAAVTVNAAGLATAVANGTAQIQATTDAKTGSATVTVDILVASLAVTPDTVVFSRIAVTRAFSVVALDANSNPIANAGVGWTSRNVNFVTVNATGTATSVADGAAYVVATATSNAAARDSVLVTVAAVANAVTVTPTSVSLNALGATQQLTGTVRDSGNTAIPNRTVSWALATSNGAATVSASGLVTAVTNGVETVTASAAGPAGPITTNVSVTVAQTVATVTVTSSGSTLFYAGATMAFNADARDANNNAVTPTPTITWASTSTGVATVAPTTGTSTTATAGLTSGNTDIQATAGGVTGSKTLTVNRIVASVSVTNTTSNRVNGTDTLTSFTGTTSYNGSALDSGGTAISGQTFNWSTSNTRLATISPSTGASTTATVAGEGTATITATSGGKSAQATLVMVLPAVSFATDVQAIFTASCAKSGCHDQAGSQGGLNLSTSPSSSYSRIVGVPSGATQQYIKPNDVANSIIILRAEGTQTPRMPADGPPFLSQATMALLRTWVTRGAPNN